MSTQRYSASSMDHTTVESATPLLNHLVRAQARLGARDPWRCSRSRFRSPSLASRARPKPLSGIVRQVDAGQFRGGRGRHHGIAGGSAARAGESGVRSHSSASACAASGSTSRSRGTQAFTKLRGKIPDLSAAEFEAWDAAGLLEHMDIDGERRWFNRAPSNLFRLSAEAARAQRPTVRALRRPHGNRRTRITASCATRRPRAAGLALRRGASA